MAETLLRLVFSLGVVLGLLMLIAKVAGRRLRGAPDAGLRVVRRQGLSRGTSLVVVAVGERALLLGATEHQVQLLTELTREELDAIEPVPAPTSVAAPGSFSGSLVSLRTWRQAVQAVTRRAP